MSSRPQLALQTEAAPRSQNMKRPFIRVARFDDYDQIAALEARHGLTVKSREEWLDLWLDNPAYVELSDWPIGWVVENEAGEIVGSLGNVPAFFNFGGRRYVSSAGRGWAVDIPYRAYSVMLLARQSKQSSADVILTTTPGRVTAAVCSQLGWCRVPVGEWDRSAFWVTNYTKAVQSYLGAKTSKLISAVVGKLVAGPLLLKDAIARRPRTLKSGYSLEWAPAFDGRFDKFWEELQEQRPDLLLAARDSETLSWHFKHAIAQDRTWILAACKGSRMVGYAILELRDIQSLDLTRSLFVDLQTLSKDSDLSSAMVEFALQRCRSEGVHVLENQGCWMEKLLPVKPPPYRRNFESWCYLYRVINRDLERSLGGAASWYPTQYDGDASI